MDVRNSSPPATDARAPAQGSEPAGRRRIRAAALRLFAQRGLEGTSIRDIARAAGVTNPALYKHFASKDALALDVFLGCYNALWQRLRSAVEAQADFERRLAAFVAAFAQAIDDDPDAVLFVNGALHELWSRVPPEMTGRTVAGLALQLVREGVSTGAIPDDTHARVRVLGLVGQLFQLSRMLQLRMIEGPATRWVPELQRQLRRMLGEAPPPA